MKKIMRSVLFALIPAVIFSIGILILSTSDKPVVKYQPEIVRSGYQTEPAAYIVEASYSKYWHDSRLPILIALGYIIAVGGTIVIKNADTESKSGAWGLAAVWIVGLLMVFIPMAAKYGSSSYESTLTVEQYEANKNNLDALFPSIERHSK